MSDHPKNAWHEVKGIQRQEFARAEAEALRRYGDIIDLEHHITDNHRRASRNTRAAQFLPFAALTGYDAAIEEAARLTETKTELSEDEKNELDRRITSLASLGRPCRVRITVFEKDRDKEGGAYVTLEKVFRRIDPLRGRIEFQDRTSCAAEDIADIELCDEDIDL